MSSRPQKAHYLVSRAIRSGKLKPAFTLYCIDCGIKAQCYDHRFYSKPLEVEPVCYKCNSKRGKAFDWNLSDREEGARFCIRVPASFVKRLKALDVNMSDFIRKAILHDLNKLTKIRQLKNKSKAS